MTGLLQITLEKKLIKITLGPEGLESLKYHEDFFVVLSVFCMLTLFACCRLASSTWWGICLWLWAYIFSALSSESFSKENPMKERFAHPWTTQVIMAERSGGFTDGHT